MRICTYARGMRSIDLHGVFLVTSDELVRLSLLRCHVAAAKASEQAHREALAHRHGPRSVGDEEAVVEVVRNGEDDTCRQEANNGEHHPVFEHPEDEFDITCMPRVAKVVSEETPGMVVVLVREQNSNSATIETIAIIEAFGAPMTPNDAQEERTSRSHDSDVRQNPLPVVARQVVNDTHKERVTRDGTHCIVGDTSGQSAAQPSWIREQRVKTTVAAIVEVEIDTTIVGEDKVADGISALDWEFVVVEGLEEPRVFCSDELARGSIGPQLVFPIFVQFDAALLRFLPDFWNALVYVCLVNNFGDHLWATVDQIRARSRELGTRDCIFRAVDNQER